MIKYEDNEGRLNVKITNSYSDIYGIEIEYNFSDILLNEPQESKYDNKINDDFELLFEYLKYDDGTLYEKKYTSHEINDINNYFKDDPKLILNIVSNKPIKIDIQPDIIILKYSINIQNILKTINIQIPIKQYSKEEDFKYLNLERLLRVKDIKQQQLEKKIDTLQYRIKTLEEPPKLCETMLPFDKLIIESVFEVHNWLLNINDKIGFEPSISRYYIDFIEDKNKSIHELVYLFFKKQSYKLLFNIQKYSIDNSSEIHLLNNIFYNKTSGQIICFNNSQCYLTMKTTNKKVNYGTKKQQIFNDIYHMIVPNNCFIGKKVKILTLYKTYL